MMKCDAARCTMRRDGEQERMRDVVLSPACIRSGSPLPLLASVQGKNYAPEINGANETICVAARPSFAYFETLGPRFSLPAVQRGEHDLQPGEASYVSLSV